MKEIFADATDIGGDDELTTGDLRRVASLVLPIRALAYAPPYLWIAEPRLRHHTGYAEPGEVVRFDLRTRAKQSVPVGTDPSALKIEDLGVAPLESIEAIVPTYLWRFRPHGQFQTRQTA